MYLGQKSLLSLRDQLFGMSHAFGVCGRKDALVHIWAFVDWYHGHILKDKNGYACWWNHLLYTSGGMDDIAFDGFYRAFERYLEEVRGLRLPEV